MRCRLIAWTQRRLSHRKFTILTSLDCWVGVTKRNRKSFRRYVNSQIAFNNILQRNDVSFSSRSLTDAKSIFLHYSASFFSKVAKNLKHISQPFSCKTQFRYLYNCLGLKYSTEEDSLTVRIPLQYKPGGSAQLKMNDNR